MNKVFVLDKNKKPIMPCSTSRARQLLAKGKASVLKLYPFTILIKERTGKNIQPVEIKLDPGSKTSGIALVGHFTKSKMVLWTANLQHRGNVIRSSLASRRAMRRSRRNRKTRYRISRFDNRRRKEGWLAPSLQSRVDNIETLVKRLQKRVPITSIALETVRFDMQKIQDPEITGISYQQGDLLGYEIREYLLEKWGRKCAYCQAENTRLEIDHILPKSRGGSDRVSNLAIVCRDCNLKKGNSSLEDFLKNKSLSSEITAKSKTPLTHAAAVNSTRKALANTLSLRGLPLTLWSGGRTKYNRVKQGYNKDHWIDAACVGDTGENILIDKSSYPLLIQAKGRGSRQFCLPNKYGFPRTCAKKQTAVHDFRTGDIVKAIVTKGKKTGSYFGRVAVRHSGNFCIATVDGKADGISYKYCKNIQRADGYVYISKKQKRGAAFPPVLKDGVSTLSIR